MLSSLVIAAEIKKAHRNNPCWTVSHAGFFGFQLR
jgi:hypothetical protein